MEADLAYYGRRAAEERLAAARSANPHVRSVHLELAGHYEERVEALAADCNDVQLRLVPAA